MLLLLKLISVHYLFMVFSFVQHTLHLTWDSKWQSLRSEAATVVSSVSWGVYCPQRGHQCGSITSCALWCLSPVLPPHGLHPGFPRVAQGMRRREAVTMLPSAARSLLCSPPLLPLSLLPDNWGSHFLLTPRAGPVRSVSSAKLWGF